MRVCACVYHALVGILSQNHIFSQWGKDKSKQFSLFLCSVNIKKSHLMLLTVPVVEAVYSADGKLYPAEVIHVVKSTDKRSGLQFKIMFLGMQLHMHIHLVSYG